MSEINSQILFKDQKHINQKSHLEMSLKQIADIIKDAKGVCENRPVLIDRLLNRSTGMKEHTPKHDGCKGCTDAKSTEKRMCRCMYYYMKNTAICSTCMLSEKWNNIGEVQIVDHEVPTKYVKEKVGAIDLIIRDKGQLYAVEVKPLRSKETLARMFAEILTYTIELNVQNETERILPAICLFEGSEQMRQYFKLINKKNPDLLYIKQFIKVYCVKRFCTSASDIIDFKICDIEYANMRSGTANLRECLTEVIANDLCPIPDEKRDIRYKYYYKDYTDNLIYEMDKEHRCQYQKGNGNELEPSGMKPAKMASLASSSAMTFNILGNQFVDLKTGSPFSSGRYSVEYEKQMYTLNKGSNPANLDAFLANTESKEAIFCEMKMLEWLGSPGKLKDAYLNPEYYFNEEAYQIFSNIAKAMIKDNPRKREEGHRSLFSKYDAWQMFKHTLAIYNYTSNQTKDIVTLKGASSSLSGTFKKIVLANVVYEMDPVLIHDESIRNKYLRELNQERKEAQAFIDLMLNPQYGLKELFHKHAQIDFDIMYIPVKTFISYIEKTTEELNRIKRYCV